MKIRLYFIRIFLEPLLKTLTFCASWFCCQLYHLGHVKSWLETTKTCVIAKIQRCITCFVYQKRCHFRKNKHQISFLLSFFRGVGALQTSFEYFRLELKNIFFLYILTPTYYTLFFCTDIPKSIENLLRQYKQNT